MVGLMTQFESVSSPIRLKSPTRRLSAQISCLIKRMSDRSISNTCHCRNVCDAGTIVCSRGAPKRGVILTSADSRPKIAIES
jgi:hypothetical protein